MSSNSEVPRDRPPRDRILDAASEVFAEVGFAGARVDVIAARAAVNKAMLYYYIGDKQKLYTAVFMRNLDRVARAMDDARHREGSVPERLHAVVEAVVRAVEDSPDHPRIVLREVASGGANLPPEVLLRMLEVVDVVRELLTEGMEKGALRGTDPLLTHLTLVGAVVFLTSVKPLRARAAELEPGIVPAAEDLDLAAFLSDLILKGLQTENAAGGTR
jgi:AcrR family transcriptional regulator